MPSLIAGAGAVLCLIIVVEFLVRVHYLRAATPKRLADLRRDLVDREPSDDLLDVAVKHLGTRTFGRNPFIDLTRRRFIASIRLGLRFPFLQSRGASPDFDAGAAAAALGMLLDRGSMSLLFREQRRLGPDTRATWALAVMGNKRVHRYLVELHSAGEMSDREWREIERIVVGDQMGDDSPAPGRVRFSALEKAAKRMYGEADSHSVFKLANLFHDVDGPQFDPMWKAREAVGDKFLGELKEVVSRLQQGRIDFTDSATTRGTRVRPASGSAEA